MSSKVHYLQKAAVAAQSSKKAMLHGSVVVQGHRVVSIAYNDSNHAEVNAINRYLTNNRGRERSSGKKGQG